MPLKCPSLPHFSSSSGKCVFSPLRAFLGVFRGYTVLIRVEQDLGHNWGGLGLVWGGLGWAPEKSGDTVGDKTVRNKVAGDAPDTTLGSFSTPLSAHLRHTLGRVSVDTRTTLHLPLPYSRRHTDTLSGRGSPALGGTLGSLLTGVTPFSFRVALLSFPFQLGLPHSHFPFNWGCHILISHSTYLAPTSAGKMPLHFIYRAHESLTSHNLIFNI